jgi:ABC-type transporter Mla subunit MlaD
MTLQTELMIDQVTSTPEMQQMLLNTTRFADVSERLATVAEGLPQQLVEVRRTSRELFSDLNAQQAEIRPLIGDVQRTLETSSLLTDKINATIQALAPLYDRINASPTDFSDYLEALDRGIILVDRATTLLAKAEPLLGPEGQPVNPDFVDGILEHVDTHSQRVLDRGFTQGIILIGVFLFGLLLVLVTYKLVSLRIERAK